MTKYALLVIVSQVLEVIARGKSGGSSSDSGGVAIPVEPNENEEEDVLTNKDFA